MNALYSIATHFSVLEGKKSLDLKSLGPSFLECVLKHEDLTPPVSSDRWGWGGGRSVANS